MKLNRRITPPKPAPAPEPTRHETVRDEVIYVPVTSFVAVLATVDTELETNSGKSTNYLVGMAHVADLLREALLRFGVTA